MKNHSFHICPLYGNTLLPQSTYEVLVRGVPTNATDEFDNFMVGSVSLKSPNSKMLLLLFGQGTNIVLKCTPVCYKWFL